KLDHRSAPSFWAERDWVIDSPPIPRARPGDGRHDQRGNFQTALLGRITPASTGGAQEASDGKRGSRACRAARGPEPLTRVQEREARQRQRITQLLRRS